MFTKEERLFIWKEAYREIEELRTGEYICVALKHAVFKFGDYIPLYTTTKK